MSPRSSNRGVCSIGPIGFHLVEDLFAFHQRKGEERDFPQGNAEGRDSGARESWLEDERASWVIFLPFFLFFFRVHSALCLGSFQAGEKLRKLLFSAASW